MQLSAALLDKIKNLPERPGVYIMKDEQNEIIYIGKAISLKNRVRQYFQSSKNHAPKVLAMVEKIQDFEYILTDSELEALILECNLIKKHRPRYNILLKDDKHYPYIKVTLQESYPRVLIARDIKKDGAKYFGPYTDLSAVNNTLELIKRLFPIRTCNRNIEKTMGKERPCLMYYINRCKAPCQGFITKEDYRDIIKAVCLVLDGKYEELVADLEKNMQAAAENMDFEKAAEIRDNIYSLKKTGEKQKIISSTLNDQDIIAYAKDDKDACVQIFFIRGGKLIGREHFLLNHTAFGIGGSSSAGESLEENPSASEGGEIMCGFIKQFYNQSVFVPREILISCEIEETEILEKWLSEKRGSKVKILTPQRGEKLKLVDMVRKNAEDTLKVLVEKEKQDTDKTIGACYELAELLQLEEVPERIEAFDISNLQGVENVASMIVFENGKAKYKDYRRFKIKWVEGANDYESMREVLRRRFEHGLKEREQLLAQDKDLESGKFSQFPNLIMMDGGQIQVNAALSVLADLKLTIPVCGMVKDDKHRTRGLLYQNKEIEISKHSHAFRMITHVQDEAHRFAINYHRSLREQSSIKSVLDDIPGVGPARRKALLKHFGSVKNIKLATMEDLTQVDGMNKKTAETIYNFFRT